MRKFRWRRPTGLKPEFTRGDFAFLRAEYACFLQGQQPRRKLTVWNSGKPGFAYRSPAPHNQPGFCTSGRFAGEGRAVSAGGPGGDPVL